MSQQSIFISDGGGSGNNASITASNQPDGGYSIQSLIAQYNSVAPSVSDGYLSFLQVDVNGNLKTTATVSFTYVANDGAALPAQTAWMGASDGTNLQGLMVESAGDPNLRTAIYDGANQLAIDSDGYITVKQGSDSPWTIDGTVAATQSGTWTVDAVQSGTWTVQAVQSGAWTVAATQSGTWTVEQGTPPWSFVGTYASNVAAGSDAVKSLVGRYQSVPAAVGDGNLTYLLTDGYGRLQTTAIFSPEFTAVDNTALPTETAWIGASDGTNLQGLEVESASFANLKVGLWDGATMADISGQNSAAGNGLQVLPAQYRSAVTAVTNTNMTYAQTDGYGRLEVAGARAAGYKYETAANQTVVLKSGAGVMRKLILTNAGSSGATTTFYDNTAGSGTIIAVVNTSNILGQLEFDIMFSTGLTYVTDNKDPGDFTVTWE